MIILDQPDGSQNEAYSLVEGAKYLGIPLRQLTDWLKIHNEIKRYRRELGGVELYITKVDLDKYKAEKQRQAEGLAELARLSEDAGLYDEETLRKVEEDRRAAEEMR